MGSKRKPSKTVRVRRKTLVDLVSAGVRMSNACFNLKQKDFDFTLDIGWRETLGKIQKEWDAALSRLPKKGGDRG